MSYNYKRRQPRLPGIPIKKAPVVKGLENGVIPEKTVEQIALIRKIAKSKAKTLSVTGGSGTVYGWVYIRGSGPHGNFTKEEKKALFELGLTTREDADPGNEELISYLDREYYLKKWLGKLTPEEEQHHKKDRFERSYD